MRVAFDLPCAAGTARPAAGGTLIARAFAAATAALNEATVFESTFGATGLAVTTGFFTTAGFAATTGFALALTAATALTFAALTERTLSLTALLTGLAEAARVTGFFDA